MLAIAGRSLLTIEGRTPNFGYYAINQHLPPILSRAPPDWRGRNWERKLERADERRSAREKVLLTATIECDGSRIPVRVVNLSAHGALVTCDTEPPEGRALIFRCNGQLAKGSMAWVRIPLAGIDFDAPIMPKAFLPKALHTAHLITRDTRELDFRRPGFRGNQMSNEERQIVEEWKRKQLEDSGVGERPPPGRSDGRTGDDYSIRKSSTTNRAGPVA